MICWAKVIFLKKSLHYEVTLSGLFLSGLPIKTLYVSLLSHACYTPQPPHSPDLIIPTPLC